jgi:hypothetical protein
MLVVKTTSATVGGVSALSEPRKRVPSSRRRNPGERLGSGTRYGVFVGAGVGVFVSPVGAGDTGRMFDAGVFGCVVAGAG